MTDSLCRKRNLADSFIPCGDYFQGKLLLLSLGNETLVADIQFMFDMEERLLSLTPTTMLEIGTMVTSIGQSSHVWNADALEKKILVDVPSSKVNAKFRKRMFSFCCQVKLTDVVSNTVISKHHLISKNTVWTCFLFFFMFQLLLS